MASAVVHEPDLEFSMELETQADAIETIEVSVPSLTPVSVTETIVKTLDKSQVHMKPSHKVF